MLGKFRKNNIGFTLIELMIIISIIGILAVITFPQFNAYRQTALNATVLSDLRNAATAQESYYSDNNTYSSVLSDLTSRGYTPSPNVTMLSVVGSSTGYTMVAQHASGITTWTLAGPGATITHSP